MDNIRDLAAITRDTTAASILYRVFDIMFDTIPAETDEKIVNDTFTSGFNINGVFYGFYFRNIVADFDETGSIILDHARELTVDDIVFAISAVVSELRHSGNTVLKNIISGVMNSFTKENKTNSFQLIFTNVTDGDGLTMEIAAEFLIKFKPELRTGEIIYDRPVTTGAAIVIQEFIMEQEIGEWLSSASNWHDLTTAAKALKYLLE